MSWRAGSRVGSGEKVITLKGLNSHRERERRKRDNERVGGSEESCENWPERIKLAVLV